MPGTTAATSVRAGYVAGLVAAVTFGATAPLVKRVGGDADAQALAALLSAGACLAVGPVAVARRLRGVDSPLARRDAGPLAGLVLLGGVVAPVLLMAGLQHLGGITAALLLNLEGPFTALIGVAAFGEYLGRRAWAGAAAVFAGAMLLALDGPGAAGDLIGAVLVAGACLAWAVDNNLTQVLSVRDPFAVVGVKTLVACSVNGSVAAVRSASWPPAEQVWAVVAIGAVGYGLSVVAAVYALRLLGAARQAVVFATAPLAGVVVAVVVLDERPGVVVGIASVFVLAGLPAMIGDPHRHRHRHPAVVHEHRHRHDDGHHDHDHQPPTGADPGGRDGVRDGGRDGGFRPAHTHEHRHEALDHSGAHVSDLHHRHAHGHRDP